MKIALIVGGVVIGAGAIGGIAAGVVTSRQTDSETPGDSTTSPEKPDTKPMEPSGEMVSDDPSSNSEETTTLDNVLNSIKKENIVVVTTKDSLDERQRSDYYAFNLKDENLKVSKATNIPSEFEVELTIDRQKTTFEQLNKGMLQVNVTVKEIEKSTNKTMPLLVEGFKAGDEGLIKLLEAQGVDNDDTAKEQVLVINPKDDNVSTFITLEQLNEQKSETSVEDGMQSGLTQWLNKSTKNVTPNTTLKGVSLEGEVKLTKLEKDSKGLTYFTLNSADKNSYIKLIKTEGKTIKEAIVGVIKTTNLLATSVTVVPTNIDQDKTTALLETLAKESNMMKKFEISNSNDSLNRKLSVKIKEVPPMDDKSSQVFVHAYSVKTGDESTDVSFEVTVNFGSDKYLTTYKTSEPNQANELKEAGFSFHLYTKMLDKAGSAVRADDLVANETLKLGANLKEDNYTKPSAVPTMSNSDENSFKVTAAVTEKFPDSFKLTVMKDNYMKDIVAFASYSYEAGTESMKPLHDKVLFTPDLTLINLEATQQQQ